jgi:hypothetical protein
MTLVLSFLRENAIFFVVLAVLAGAYLFLRQGPSSVASAEQFDEVVQSGKPVLVMFYSDT